MILTTVLISCLHNHRSSNNNLRKYVSIDLDSIRTRGKLIGVTEINSTDYLVYKGEPMGFNYELLKTFSAKIGVELEIINENNLEHAFEMLKSGQADIMAFGLIADSLKDKDIFFTVPIIETRKVLVQMKPANWRSLTMNDLDKKLVRDRKGLAKKTIYIQEGSSNVQLLYSLMDEIKDSINIVEVPFDSEMLIKQVASGEIGYTVCNENVASVNSTYYYDIDVSTPLSAPKGLSWGLRKNNSDSLMYELNSWITAFSKTELFSLLYSKYFKNPRSGTIVRSNYYAFNTGKICRYDNLIKKYSETIKWDWRLLASLIYQESRFEPDVKSGAGAFGLMQVMPVTGKYFGIDITSSPENNLKAGILYINWLNRIFYPMIKDDNERINFILASYNAGTGHIFDAIKLAEKNGKDSRKWNGNVAPWLLKMADPIYYNDPVVKNGYFRGIESVKFVNEVRSRFEQYKNIISAEGRNPF